MRHRSAEMRRSSPARMLSRRLGQAGANEAPPGRAVTATAPHIEETVMRSQSRATGSGGQGRRDIGDGGEGQRASLRLDSFAASA